MLTNPLLPIGARPLPRDLFRFDVESSVEDWSAIDDRVMSGVSNSRTWTLPVCQAFNS